MKKQLFLFITTMMLMTSTVFAHTGLKSSTPKDNAMLMASPKKLHLEFTKKVVLVKVNVTDTKGKQVSIDFKPSMTATTSYDIVLPSLTANTYHVNWVVMGTDSHKMNGNFSFMVHRTNESNTSKMEDKDNG